MCMLALVGLAKQIHMSRARSFIEIVSPQHLKPQRVKPRLAKPRWDGRLLDVNLVTKVYRPDQQSFAGERLLVRPEGQVDGVADLKAANLSVQLKILNALFP